MYTRSVILPCSQAKIEKELQEGEKVFGDLLLMLLPGKKTKFYFDAKFIRQGTEQYTRPLQEENDARHN